MDVPRAQRAGEQDRARAPRERRPARVEGGRRPRAFPGDHCGARGDPQDRQRVRSARSGISAGASGVDARRRGARGDRLGGDPGRFADSGDRARAGSGGALAAARSRPPPGRRCRGTRVPDVHVRFDRDAEGGRRAPPGDRAPGPRRRVRGLLGAAGVPSRLVTLVRREHVRNLGSARQRRPAGPRRSGNADARRARGHDPPFRSHDRVAHGRSVPPDRRRAPLAARLGRAAPRRRRRAFPAARRPRPRPVPGAPHRQRIRTHRRDDVHVLPRGVGGGRDRGPDSDRPADRRRASCTPAGTASPSGTGTAPS